MKIIRLALMTLGAFALLGYVLEIIASASPQFKDVDDMLDKLDNTK